MKTSRRSLLKGIGSLVALPYLEVLGFRAPKGIVQTKPKRFLGAYGPFGFSLPGEGQDKRESGASAWNWYPKGTEHQWEFRKSLQPLTPLKEHVTIIKGLEHPRICGDNGHKSADGFLTSTSIKAASNTISMDQVLMSQYGHETHYASMVLSNHGGLGARGNSFTLSFDASGRPIPSRDDIKVMFENLFINNQTEKTEKYRLFNAHSSILDLIVAPYKSAKNQLPKSDKERLESYFESIRSVESHIQKQKEWLEIERPDVKGHTLDFNATVLADPEKFIRNMYELIYLAFITDSTRYATYMHGSMGGDRSGNIIKTLGIMPINHHTAAHNARSGKGMIQFAQYDLFNAKMLAEFMSKLHDFKEADGSALDNTIILYGTSNAQTHANNNYPILVAGGKGLGLKQNRFLDIKKENKVPLSNVQLSIMKALGSHAESFGDSTNQPFAL